MHSSLRPASNRTASMQQALAPATPPTRHLIWRGLGALLLAVAALLGASTAASAHDTLTDSSPAEGDTLTEAPSEVRLTYSATILELGAAVEVTDADGDSWPTGELVVDGPHVTVPLPEELPNGAYEVTWRVTSSDGHPISGVIPFTVAASATETAPAAPAPTTQAQDQAGETSEAAASSTESTATEEAEDGATSEAAEAAADDTATADADATTSPEDGSSVPWTPIVICLVVLAAALGLFAAVRRRGADQ